MSTLSNAPLLASLADEALLHGSTGPQPGDAEDASSQPPASPAEKGAPRPTARWYLGEVDALRLHIPVKSAKGLMELRWALGQKPPAHLTIIADQLPVLETYQQLYMQSLLDAHHPSHTSHTAAWMRCSYVCASCGHDLTDGYIQYTHLPKHCQANACARV
jgi:hypothetical protein